MTKLIRDWKELKNCTSETHTLIIEDGVCGHIRKNDESDGSCYHYLSTHTFYGMIHKSSTYHLQKAGFDVIIDNWDNPLPEDLDKETYLKTLLAEYDAKAEAYHTARLKENERQIIHETSIELDAKRKERNIAEYSRRKMQGRNTLCNCGSGIKFKKCCGRA